MRQITMHIEGMSCGHCLNAVNQALAAVPGVAIESVQIGRATVRFDDALTTTEQIVQAVSDAGYKAAV